MKGTRHDIFAQTRWTLIRRAAGSDTAAREALAGLCGTYWQPLYAYLRKTGRTPPDAEDLTQGFFERLLRLDSLATVRREEGKFRAFLLASLKHYLADQHDMAHAQKRDVRLTIPLDGGNAETRYLTVPADALTPDQMFERQWAITLLERVMRRLAVEYDAAGKGELFAELRFAIAGEKSAVPYSELSARIGMSEEAVRVAVHRLRQRYRTALREELAQTVSSEEEVLEELRYLRRILSR